MKITLKLFALLSAYLPPGACGHEAEIEVPEGATAGAVIADLNLPGGMSHLVLVNGAYVAPGERDRTRLKPGDSLAIWPPVAGG